MSARQERHEHEVDDLFWPTTRVATASCSALRALFAFSSNATSSVPTSAPPAAFSVLLLGLSSCDASIRNRRRTKRRPLPDSFAPWYRPNVPSPAPSDSIVVAEPAPAPTEIVVRPAGLRHGRWEAPTWAFYAMAGVLVLGALLTCSSDCAFSGCQRGSDRR